MAENENKYIVDVGEEQSNAGQWVVTATAKDGTVEKAVFSGRRAPELAMAYVEAIDEFEKRPPLEYPKIIRRGGIEHIVLDKEHEDKYGPESDADKANGEANRAYIEGEAERHRNMDEARERAKASPALNPKPERVIYGEDDRAYSERLAKWQDERRGDKPGTSDPLPALEGVGPGDESIAVRANTAFETDSTKIPSVEGVLAGEQYKPVDHVNPLDGVHAGGNSRAANVGAADDGKYPGNSYTPPPSRELTSPSKNPKE